MGEVFHKDLTGDDLHDPKPHGNEVHDPDFLAVDGSNSPTADIDWGGYGVKNLGWRTQILKIPHKGSTAQWFYLGRINTVDGSTTGGERGYVHVELYNARDIGDRRTAGTILIATTRDGGLTAKHINLGEMSDDDEDRSYFAIYNDGSNNFHLYFWQTAYAYSTIVIYHNNHQTFEAIEQDPSGTQVYHTHQRGTLPISAGALRLSDSVDMGSNKIINLANPTDAQDAATKNYVDTNFASSSHGNEAHNPDFLAVDGSNSPTGDIDWNSKGVYEIGYLVGTKYGYGTPPLLEPLHNILAYADKKWTVTVSPAPTGNSVAGMFDFIKNVPTQWNDTVTLPIEITIEWTDPVNLIKAVGIQFHWDQYISGVKIEAYNDNTGTWTTLIDESNNTTNRVLWTGNLNYITKIRYTLSGTYNTSVVSVANLFALSNHSKGLPYGYYLDVEGNMPMRGNLDMNSNRIINLADPTNAQDAATKNYADGKLPLDTSSAIDAYISGNKWLSVATSGIVGLPKQSACRMYLSTAQSIPSDTVTKVALDAKSFDIQDEGDTTNHKITVTESGIYLVIGQVGWDAVEREAQYQAAIKVNGSYRKVVNIIAAESNKCLDVVATCVLSLNAGDDIELYAFQDSGKDASLLATHDHTALEVVKVA